MKERIIAWLSPYRTKVSGTVALQEFKRRVLRDVAYILGKLNKTGSYQTTLNYISNVLTGHHLRKQRICIPILHNVLPGRTDQELTERARRYCRTLLVYGEKLFRDQLTSIVPGIDCYWARMPIREKKRYLSYDLGETKCSKSKKQCQVANVLAAKRGTCEKLLAFMRSLPPQRMTKELQSACQFLDKVINSAALQGIHSEEPCLTVGDLLLALESEGIQDFYTMNYKESQAYCDFFEQNLTIRPNNPLKAEQTYSETSKPWPHP